MIFLFLNNMMMCHTRKTHRMHIMLKGLSWSWSYGSWIYNYLCNPCLSSLTLWVQTPLRRGVLDTTLCDKVCQWLATGQWFSPGAQVSSTNKTDSPVITKILLKVVLNTINHKPSLFMKKLKNLNHLTLVTFLKRCSIKKIIYIRTVQI